MIFKQLLSAGCELQSDTMKNTSEHLRRAHYFNASFCMKLLEIFFLSPDACLLHVLQNLLRDNRLEFFYLRKNHFSYLACPAFSL